MLGTKQTPADNFAADATANGFYNNAAALTLSVNDLQFYETAAEGLATELTNSNNTQFKLLAPCADAGGSAACVATFVSAMGLRAWRRPLTNAEAATVVATATATSGDTYAQEIQKATIVLLMSPYFIFRVEIDSGTDPNTVHALSAYKCKVCWPIRGQ